jgi:hypothetical protein
VSGSAGTAGSATTAGTVTTNAQSNITSVGTLGNLSVSDFITTGNLFANAGLVQSNIATFVTSANIAGTLIDSTGIAMTAGSNLQVGNNITASNVSAGNLSGRVDRQAMSQVISGRDSSAVPATVNYDVYNNQFVYYTDFLSANVTLNFRGNATANLNSVLPNNTTTFNTILLSQGTGNTYYISNVTVDGSSSNVTVLWNQTPSTVTSGKPIVYKFTINNESNNYYILGDWYNTA